MFCINCSSAKTRVTNSRPSKKEASIWRRRSCSNCGKVFTTREEVAIEDELRISVNGAKQSFSLPRLTVYLNSLLIHRGTSAPDEAFWLAKTIRRSLDGPEVSTPQLVAATATVLDHFDAIAALQHATKQGLLTNISRTRRGRPRLKRTDN